MNPHKFINGGHRFIYVCNHVDVDHIVVISVTHLTPNTSIPSLQSLYTWFLLLLFYYTDVNHTLTDHHSPHFLTAGYFFGQTVNTSIPFWLHSGQPPVPVSYTYWCPSFDPLQRPAYENVITLSWKDGLCWTTRPPSWQFFFICEI